MARIELVRGTQLEASASTQGIRRGKAFEAGITFGRTEVQSGAASAWHHQDSDICTASSSPDGSISGTDPAVAS